VKNILKNRWWHDELLAIWGNRWQKSVDDTCIINLNDTLIITINKTIIKTLTFSSLMKMLLLDHRFVRRCGKCSRGTRPSYLQGRKFNIKCTVLTEHSGLQKASKFVYHKQFQNTELYIFDKGRIQYITSKVLTAKINLHSTEYTMYFVFNDPPALIFVR
jgi:hypothetical protein